MRVFLISISILALVASGAAAQSEPLNDMRRDADRTQAAAVGPANPEDETLTCEQLQAELDQSMESEDVQESLSQLEEVEASQEDANRRASQGVGGGFGAILGSILPGARPRSDTEAAARQQRDTQRSVAAVGGLSPSIMRNARLCELAQERNCPFLQED